ncbi:hypothetical protein WH47_05028 [Habropoda laboriosa]|uniref:Uncharacterized protein n=1 Tax=Habropoda laboriosa TaxID=597456 RepID=A0A0L7RJ93_9HYME|nr:hypothetical protein WH47_05028 [Habropoda laboriosa]
MEGPSRDLSREELGDIDFTGRWKKNDDFFVCFEISCFSSKECFREKMESSNQ